MKAERVTVNRDDLWEALCALSQEAREWMEHAKSDPWFRKNVREKIRTIRRLQRRFKYNLPLVPARLISRVDDLRRQRYQAKREAA